VAGVATGGVVGCVAVGAAAGAGVVARGVFWVVAGAARGVVAAGAGVGVVRGGWVVTTGGGVGAGAGVGVGCPPRSFGVSGGKAPSAGPCIPGVRPSLAGGKRKVDEGAGVGAGVSVCCANAGMLSASDAANAPSDSRAAFSLRPIVRTVIEEIRNPETIHSAGPLNWR